MAAPVPTLSIAQSKKAIVKKKKVLRNLLVNPYEVYWPVLDKEENERFSSAFERIMEAETKLDRKGVDEKEVMKLKRKKWSESIAFAINDVSRSVMKGTITAVLLADDVDPKFLVQHLATLCGAAAVPVLAISNLRKFTKKILGFSSVAIGLKKNVADMETNSFYEINQLILEIAESHKPPLSIRQFNIPAAEVYSSKKNPPVSMAKAPCVPLTPSIPAGDVYLYRTSCESRVFVPKPLYPGKSETIEVVQKPKVGLQDFMSLGEDSDFDELMDTELPVKGISYSMLNLEKNKKRKPSPPPYVPLKHIKVKPNPNKKSTRAPNP